MHLETERLILRELEPGDLPFLLELHRHPEVVRYFGGAPWSEARTRGWLESTIRLHHELGLGQHAIVRRADGLRLGRSGLVPMAVSEIGGEVRCTWRSAPAGIAARPTLELGYTLAREAWGQGYALEAARAVRDWGFEVRGEERLIALIDAGNLASIRVAHRLGFERRGPARFIGRTDDGDPHGIDVAIELFALERERWAGGRGAR